MSFEAIKAQAGPVSILKRAMENQRVPTAYLFTGPGGCGRTMAARAVAAGLNCQSGPIACGTCPSCRLYEAGSHPDLHTIGLVEGKRQISIEQVREDIIEKAYLKPMSGRTSTFILQDAHLMNMNAFNALLKTLEEPPGTSHFILISPDRDSVPATISSRCQTVSFSPLPRQVVEEVLVREGIDSRDASILAAMAKGSIKKALAYNSTGALQELAKEFEPLSSLHRYGFGQLLDLSQRWGRNRQDALGILEFMAQWYRDMMILFEGAPDDQVTHITHLEELRKGADKVGGHNLPAILESVEDAREAIEGNSNVQLTLDALFLRVRGHTTRQEKSI